MLYLGKDGFFDKKNSVRSGRPAATVKVAFVHDWLTSYTGAERLLETAMELYPSAPVYTLVYDERVFKGKPLSHREVITSPLFRNRWIANHYRSLLALMPLAIEQFDLREYDVVISSSTAVAKGVLTRSDQTHIAYVNTPMRYAWDLYNDYLHDTGLHRSAKGLVARAVLHYIRMWDFASAARPDVLIGNSKSVARRISKAYRRDAHVIYPGVDLDRFSPNCVRESYYLTVARLVPYKKVELIVEAFNRLRLPLVVIGDGPGWPAISRLAKSNVTLLRNKDDRAVSSYMERCKAFVFAAEEDFGIAIVEAQAAGAPVIAYEKGGAMETVLHGETGILFGEQNVACLMEAVLRMESAYPRISAQNCWRNASRFSKERFQTHLKLLIECEWGKLRDLGAGVAEAIPI
jgi:glycosyltransferase involved in cell wall biosynthesis